MNPAEQAALSFCSELFAGVGDTLDDYQVTILTHPGPQVRWLRGLDPAATAQAIREADARGGPDTAVYLSMAPRDPGAAHRNDQGKALRGGNSDVGALLGVWADLDVAGPAHTSGKRLPPDQAAVRRILDACGLRPTLLWSSGHGLQAFWRLAEAWRFADGDDPAAERAAAAALVRNWNLTLGMHAQRLGRWQIDATHDLARVLRPAGTTNRKIGGDWRKVETLEHHPSAVYEVADIEAHLAEQSFLERFVGMTSVPADSPIHKVNLRAVWDIVNGPDYRARNYTPEWLATLVDEDVLSAGDPLLQVFENGHESGDPSTTDASLARLTADLGLTARDAAEIIMCRRLRARDKIDKIDPHRRQSYLVMTVGKMFANAAARRAESEQMADAGERAVAAQDAAQAAPQRAAETPQPAAEAAQPLEQRAGGPSASGATPVPDDRADAVGAQTAGMGGLGGAIVAELDGDAVRVRPDPPGVDPYRDIPAPDEEPAADEPPDEPAPPAPDPAADGPTAAPPAGTHTEQQDEPQQDEPQQDEPQQPRAEQDEHASTLPPLDDDDDEPDAEPSAARPAVVAPTRSSWGSRTAHQHSELDALSETLLGPAASWARVWRLQQRGRGARAERRLVMRFRRDLSWPAAPPIGYVPGQPYATGWWPAATFSTLKGWQAVLQQDCLMVTMRIKPEDFTKRFFRSLIRLWEPDDSGGSLDNVTRDAMVSYLLDYPPVTDWTEAAEQGMPLIMQGDPAWQLESPFTVLVRWAEFGAHVRARYAVNTTPAVLSEMAELAGARAARTMSQDGRWRMVRREYLTDDQWRMLLANGAHAAMRREERHGMHVVGSESSVYGSGGDSMADERADRPRMDNGREAYPGWESEAR